MHKLHHLSVAEILEEHDLSEEDFLEHENSALVVASLPAIAWTVVVMVTGIVGNGLVMHSFYSFSRSSSRYYIITLAFYDFIVCAFVVPFNIYSAAHPLNFHNEALCIFYRTFENGAVVASAFMLAVIAVDRYVKVCYPFYRVDVRTVKIVCVATGGLAFLHTMPASFKLFGLSRVTTAVRGLYGYKCLLREDSKETSLYKLYYGSVFLFFVAILALLTTLYTRVWRTLSRHHREMIKHATTSSPGVTKVMPTSTEAHRVSTRSNPTSSNWMPETTDDTRTQQDSIPEKPTPSNVGDVLNFPPDSGATAAEKRNVQDDQSKADDGPEPKLQQPLRKAHQELPGSCEPLYPADKDASRLKSRSPARDTPDVEQEGRSPTDPSSVSDQTTVVLHPAPARRGSDGRVTAPSTQDADKPQTKRRSFLTFTLLPRQATPRYLSPSADAPESVSSRLSSDPLFSAGGSRRDNQGMKKKKSAKMLSFVDKAKAKAADQEVHFSKTTMSLVAVSVLFFISYFTAASMIIFGKTRTVSSQSQWQYATENFIVRLSFVQNVANPFIYLFFNFKFRDDVRRIIQRLTRRGRVRPLLRRTSAH